MRQKLTLCGYKKTDMQADHDVQFLFMFSIRADYPRGDNTNSVHIFGNN